MRLRYSTRGLLYFIAVMAIIAALVARYLQIERRFADQSLRYDAAVAKHEAGLSTTMELCGESFALYVAERDRWFHSSDALKSHLKRLHQMEQLQSQHARDAMFSDEFGAVKAQQVADDIRVLRESLQKSAQ